MSSKEKAIVFFIGTEAELIKVFPVILKLEKEKVPFYIVASGQNDITKSSIMKKAVNKTVDLELSYEKDIKKSAVGLLSWFSKTYRDAAKKIKKQFQNLDFRNSVMVVHGDTVSTLMGAYIGRKLGMRVVHIEAGLRSHNLLNPFPEEIDRLLTSRKADVHFAPGELPYKNLKNKQNVINTKYNTIYDSLQYSYRIANEHIIMEKLYGKPYFVFVIHRQENLAKQEFVSKIIEQVLQIAKKIQCVFILHKITENVLINMNLFDRLSAEENVVLVTRMEYFDFMKLLSEAEFVITDGGSNQEELHYMGKPCLIIRNQTERNEGIGENAILYGGDVNRISKFASNYKNYKKSPIVVSESPSETIAKYLETML